MISAYSKPTEYTINNIKQIVIDKRHVQYLLKNKERIIDLGCNSSTYLLPCVECGKMNTKDKRIDCEFFGEKKIQDSYCIPCWANKITN